MIGGIPITVNKVICAPPVFIRWARPHRRPRIAKKWRRFGRIDNPCPGIAYEMLGGLVMCPHAMTALRLHLECQRGGRE